MKPWVEDAVEQLATAQILNTAGTSTGERLALIVSDNAIEYMMIAYTEVERHLVNAVIKPGEWAQKKKDFKQLLDFTASQEPRLDTFKSDIFSFHKMRNNLYHTGMPLSVKPQVVSTYLGIGRQVVDILFGANLSQSDWTVRAAALNQVFGSRAATSARAAIAAHLAEDGTIKVTTSRPLPNNQILCIVLAEFLKATGYPPTQQQLEQSLARSGASHLSGDNLSKRIYDNRKQNLIVRDKLRLTTKGQRLVAECAVATPNP